MAIKKPKKTDKVANLDHLIDIEIDRTGYLGFPEYSQDNTEAPYIVEIKLETTEDVEALVKILGSDYDTMLHKGKRSVKSYWYPSLEEGERGGMADYIWVEA